MLKTVKWLLELWIIYLLIIQLSAAFWLANMNIGIKPVDEIKYSGLILQIIGSCIIIRSFQLKLVLFKGQKFKDLFIAWRKSVNGN